MTLSQHFDRLTTYVAACPDVDGASVHAICKQFDVMTVRRNDVVHWNGDVCDRILFVASGCMRIYIPQQEHEVTRLLAFDGDFATSLESFLSRTPSAEITQAVQDTVLLTLPYERYQLARLSIRGWHAFMHQYLQDAYINNTR